MPDIDVNYNVKDALRTDLAGERKGIVATTTDGIVTLSGSIDNLAAKTYAVAEAKKINGVLGVIDKLTVTPGFHWDTDISNAVRRRILNSPAIASQGLVVTCKDGVVTLSGTVGSYAEERQARLLASEVAGVKDVNSTFLIKWSSTRSDLEIKNDAVAALGATPTSPACRLPSPSRTASSRSAVRSATRMKKTARSTTCVGLQTWCK